MCYKLNTVIEDFIHVTHPYCQGLTTSQAF